MEPEILAAVEAVRVAELAASHAETAYTSAREAWERANTWMDLCRAEARSRYESSKAAHESLTAVLLKLAEKA